MQANLAPRRHEPVGAAAKARYHHGDLKRALTDAALALVAEKGPKGFTLTEAARRAGVSTAAPYRHFADKAELLAAVAERGFRQLYESLDAASRGVGDPRARLVALGHAYIDWAVANPDYYQVMFGGEIDKHDHPDLLAAGERTFGVLLATIADGQRAGSIGGVDPLSMAGPLWSLVHGAASLEVHGDLRQVGIDEPAASLVMRTLSLLVGGDE